MKPQTGERKNSSKNSDPNKQNEEHSMENTLNNLNSAHTNNAQLIS